MKKVEKVSIADISFTLDSDAYNSLKQYIDSLHNYYDKDPDGGEIIADIEARIAELILDEQVYTKVVTGPLIDSIVAQLGSPREIDSTADEADATGAAAHSGIEPSIPRRLHRSREGRILGGVCSGIAKYFDVSVGWIRVAFLLPLILLLILTPFAHNWHSEDFLASLLWAFAVIYVVLWCALPVARTPRQKLEARGERITPESIRQNLQEGTTSPGAKKAASVAAEILTILGQIVLFFMKFVMAVIGFSFILAVAGVIAAMVAVLLAPASIMMGHMDWGQILAFLEDITILSPLWCIELTLLSVALLLSAIGIAFLSAAFNWRPTRMFYGILLGVWLLLSIFIMVTATGVLFGLGKMRKSERIEVRSLDNSGADSVVVLSEITAGGIETDTIVMPRHDVDADVVWDNGDPDGRVEIRRVE